MEQKQLDTYNHLKDNVKNAKLRKEFTSKRNILFRLAAVTSGLCENVNDCLKHCPLSNNGCQYKKKN